jgi:ubiquinone/menaquinone biosynthesis C-methylase UbiE
VDKDTIHAAAQAQFGAVAEHYVASPRHAAGDDLVRLVELAAPRGDERLLDVATGAGHTALAFAPHVADVVASDLTPRMLELARALAAQRGVANIAFVQAPAEALPFAAASFELVTCRVAPHHFAEPDAFVSEVARVLKPGGRFLLDDQMAPADPELDAFFNRFEKWRDPSHVRAYTVEEWRGRLEAAGLRVEHVEELERGSYDFADWTAASKMPDAAREELECFLRDAPERCARFFRIDQIGERVRSLRGCFALITSRRVEDGP